MSEAQLDTDGRFQANIADIVDGPNLFMTRSTTNLGAMSSSLDRDFTTPADLKAMQEGPSLSHSFEGLYFDGPAISGSLVLLAILLALTFERILGLDQWLAKLIEDRKQRRADEERWKVIEARQQLDKQFQQDSD